MGLHLRYFTTSIRSDWKVSAPCGAVQDCKGDVGATPGRYDFHKLTRGDVFEWLIFVVGGLEGIDTHLFFVVWLFGL